jgi:3-hydroxymyristoyl/3-hydroxydecanoyl-(acyl carrier protein) dehydratase
MKFRIEADHPSLPGHFPDRPIVPAAVLLNRVLECAAVYFGGEVHVGGIDHVKFLEPLLPNEDVDTTFSRDGNRLRFTVVRDCTTIAQGSLRIVDDAIS